MMSQNRRTFVSPRHKLHLPNISFRITPTGVANSRRKTPSPTGKSPRDSGSNSQTSTRRNPKVFQESPRNIESFPPHSPSPHLRQIKTWSMNADRRQTPAGNSPRGSPDNREVGLYNPRLNDMFVLLSQREDSIALPPQDGPRGGQLQTVDQDKVREKQYVWEDQYKQPIVSRFERDELYIPSVYSKYFACRECRTAYVAKMFTKQYIRRNHRYPKCFKPSNDEKERRHFCDVLGKRFCACCMERENRKFSRSLEQLPKKPTDYSNRGTPQIPPLKPPLKLPLKLPEYTNLGTLQQPLQRLGDVTQNSEPVLPPELSLTDLTHQSHAGQKPRKVIGIDLRFATM
uniref:Uncharacterized protein LOC111137199 n=1 Tax=Crassostrea virginica TaxID=6565 RepID=A0A8B8EW95_CRAVI|nr:uncharacterized protein LOC111137199 [Crassostrea virginica]